MSSLAIHRSDQPGLIGDALTYPCLIVLWGMTASPENGTCGTATTRFAAVRRAVTPEPSDRIDAVGRLSRLG